MSAAENPAVDTRIQDSHDTRAKFERWALIVFVVSVALVLVAALAGVFWEPVPAGQPDWGASIVARVIQLKEALDGFWEVLLGGVGLTLARGHMDARLDTQRGDG